MAKGFVINYVPCFDGTLFRQDRYAYMKEHKLTSPAFADCVNQVMWAIHRASDVPVDAGMPRTVSAGTITDWERKKGHIRVIELLAAAVVLGNDHDRYLKRHDIEALTIASTFARPPLPGPVTVVAEETFTRDEVASLLADEVRKIRAELGLPA